MPRAYVRNLRRAHKDALRARFERLLFGGLAELDFEVVEQPWSPDDPAPWRQSGRAPGPHDKVIYEHRSRPQAPDGHAFYMETYFNGLFTLDRRGWGPFQAGLPSAGDLARIDCDVAVEAITALSRELLADGGSKHRQPRPGAVEIAADSFVFVPLQLSDDDSIVHHACIGVVDFVDMVGRWSRDRAVTVVFKLHPFNDDAAVGAAVARWTAGGFAHRSDANVHSLIQASRGVYTINSGCGFEALIHGRPVVTFGDCDYAAVTFRGCRENLDAAWNYICGHAQRDAQQAYRWVHFYLQRHVIDVRPDDLSGPRNRLAGRLRAILQG